MRALAIAALILLATSCVVRNLVSGPRLTGTCSGACAHYVECKAARARTTARAVRRSAPTCSATVTR